MVRLMCSLRSFILRLRSSSKHGFDSTEDGEALVDGLCSLAGGNSGVVLWGRFGGLSFVGSGVGGGCVVAVAGGGGAVAVEGGADDAVSVDVSCSDVCVGVSVGAVDVSVVSGDIVCSVGGSCVGCVGWPAFGRGHLEA